ncbi:MAG: kelch repeat-containing protein, partial [Myxococcota bacterium]|nr:kelch repeat-containing protein [Myxococcota bacterium]
DDGDASVSSTCFPDFDGTVGAAWTALASPGDDLYSLMVYQTDDIPVLVNAYASGGAGAQQYDPTTDTWSTDAAAVPYNSPWTSMAPWNGDLWMIRNGFVYQYEVATGTWTVVTTSGALDDLNMTESDEFGVIYGHDSRGYMVEYDTTTGSVSFFVTGLGGQYETRLAYDPGTRSIFYGAYDEPELYRYDIASKGSAAVSPIPESQLNDIFCADRSGHIYAAGGSGGTTMFQYDIASDSWSAIPDLPTDHGNNGSCTVSADGWLYVGAGSNRTFYRVELY